MKLCKRVINRQIGNGLNIPKFHGMLHHIWNIKRHGTPTNFDTTSLESNLKENGKYPASTTVKGADVFQYQLGSRMTDSILINTITQQKFPDKYSNYKSWTINHSAHNQDTTCENMTKQGTKFKMKVDRNNITFDIKDISNNSPKDKLKYISKLFPTGVYKCLTEVKIGDDIFRGNYCYKGKSSWNDYALFNWSTSTNSVPGRIDFFINVDTDDIKKSLHVHSTGIYALIQSCDDNQCQYIEGSKIVQQGYLETDSTGVKVFRLIHIASINSTCFAIPDIGSENDNSILILQPPSTWGEIFINRTYQC